MSGDILEDIQAAVASAAPAEVEAPATEAPEAPEAPAEAAPEAEAAVQEGRTRDEAGRFAKKAQEKPQAAKAAPKPVATVKPTAPAPKPAQALEAPAPEAAEAKPASEALKAPQSWKPAAREKWASLPPEVQAEAVRLDKEVRATMQGAAEARKVADGFRQAVEPYRALFTDEPMRVVGNLVHTAARLQLGQPQEKAAILASMVRNFNVPIEALDAALSGQAPAQGQQGGQYMDPRALAAQVEQQVLQRFQTQQQHALSRKAAQDVEAFAANAEFLEDVRDDMAIIMQVAAQQGRNVTLEQAYSLACQQHPEIAGVLKQREAAKQAETAQAATQRARAAASSVKSQPAGVTPPKQAGSILEEVQAQAARLSGRTY